MPVTYPVYPASLPCVSRIDGYGMNAAAAVIKTPLEFANSRQRRMHARMPQEIQLAWRCSNDQVHPVTTWLNAYGYDWFKLYLAGIEASQDNVFAKKIIVRLMSDIQTSLMPIYRQNWWVVRASAEYQVPVESLLIGEEEEEMLMMESTAMFIPLTLFFEPEPTTSAFSDGFEDEGFS